MTADVTLTRLESTDQGTFGRLRCGMNEWHTGELPWRENAPSVSCIPTGTYLCRWTYSPRFKRRMYLVDAVPERAGIRIHAANLMGDKEAGYRAQLNGCIALGERLGWIEGQKAVLLSAPAVRAFDTLMNGKPFTLEIKNHA